MKFFLFLFVFLLCLLRAESIDTNASYLDTAHKIISDKVTGYSDTLDQTISKLFTGKKAQNAYDDFFKNEKYFNETEKSFVSVNLNTQFQSKYREKTTLNINANIALQRTNQKLNLFVSGINENKKIIDKNAPTELGLNYFRADRYNIQSRYSIGVRGFYPFIRARYYKIFAAKSWKIEPMQLFEYSSKDAFKESTFIYFDKTLADKSLLRVTLQRETQTKIKGMDYAVSTQYYWNFYKKNILSISEILSGNTEYTTETSTRKYSGINNYATVLTFRKNIWKKWFFYQVSPSVNFHKENDYKANYAIAFLVNLYFGDFD
ncbi:hypothetical protein FJR45_07110 [Sulfurimonas sediminis]|uniref:DUF2860 domain-containing protein n=1 Tax=Sulfurimonas sediminis TaxID=2590020 RepID=A0A7M1B1W6_9BACT|nr:hypothetical protein [Sulfurimonas sediminis]QOP43731.1 hypothetical protein FJR45_07110 [Sulfurimonas sediminis]